MSDQDKFVHSLLHWKSEIRTPHPCCVTYDAFKKQSRYDFGYIPLTDNGDVKVRDVGRHDDTY